jgi:DNA polymerase-4
MDRQIVCFSVPTLEIALARVRDPLLRHRPLAVTGRLTPHSAIQEASAEAERDGVHVGMPLRHAMQHCPNLHVLRSDAQRLQHAEQVIVDVIRRYAALWEPTSRAGWWMDLTGTRRLWGCIGDSASRIQRDIAHDCGLSGVVGVGSNKLIAQTAATLAEPDQVYEVRPGSEQAFIAPLPVHALPVLGGSSMRGVVEMLDDLNLRTLGDIADVPIPSLRIAVGKWALPLSHWARGMDSSPVRLPLTQSQWEAARDLQPDEIDDHRIHGILFALLQHLCRMLRRSHRVCHLLIVTVRYSDAQEVTRQQPIKPGSCWEAELMPHLRCLMGRLFRRRVRLNRIRVGMAGLTASAEQLSLFQHEAPSTQGGQERARRLAMALDHLCRRFGERAIRYGHQASQ